MIPKEVEQKILLLYHAEKWKVGTIARQLGVHHDTVARVLCQAGVVEARRDKASIIDPYIPFIEATLEKYPSLRASRLHVMVKERGYTGGRDHFRHLIARLRPRPKKEAFLRLRTLPGEQAQVDWAHFGKHTVGKAQRLLMAFVMVLSWSRQIFLRFFLGHQMPHFLRGHVEAFDFYGGVPRVILSDNLKSEVLERQGDAIRFHPQLLDLAGHYRFEPRPVAVYRANQKGRVERAIQYVRGRFFAGRTWKDVADLNRQAREWCLGEAGERRHPDDPLLTVAKAFEQEKVRLLPLPDNPFPTDHRVEVSVGKDPYVTFDLNDYSIPHDLGRRPLVVVASEDTVRILDGNAVVATHPRSYDKWAQIEDPLHVEALELAKREARQSRGMDRLHHTAPSSHAFLVLVAERGGNLGATTVSLLRMLDTYGAADLEQALSLTVAKDTSHLGSVRQVLDQIRQARGTPPPVSVHLPDDPRVKNLYVKPHDLKPYDALPKEKNDEEDDTAR